MSSFLNASDNTIYGYIIYTHAYDSSEKIQGKKPKKYGGKTNISPLLMMNTPIILLPLNSENEY